MDLNLLRQDIKKINLLIAFQQNLSSGQNTADFCRYWKILVKNRYPFITCDLKAFFYFLALIFFPLTLAMIFFVQVFCQGLNSEGERLKVKFFLWKW